MPGVRTGEDVAKELAQTFGMNYVFAPEFLELGQGTAEDPAYHGQALLTTLAVHASRMIRFQHQSGWWKPRQAAGLERSAAAKARGRQDGVGGRAR